MKLRVLPTQIVISHDFTCRKGENIVDWFFNLGGITIQRLTQFAQASPNVKKFQGFSKLQQILFVDDWIAPWLSAFFHAFWMSSS